MQAVHSDGSPVDPDATWPKEYNCEINGKRPCGRPTGGRVILLEAHTAPSTLPGHLTDVQGSDSFRELTPTARCAGKRPQWVKRAKLESLGCATVPLSATVPHHEFCCSPLSFAVRVATFHVSPVEAVGEWAGGSRGDGAFGA